MAKHPFGPPPEEKGKYQRTYHFEGYLAGDGASGWIVPWKCKDVVHAVREFHENINKIPWEEQKKLEKEGKLVMLDGTVFQGLPDNKKLKIKITVEAEEVVEE